MTSARKHRYLSEYDPHFGVFYELMAFKVREILLVSSPYDAYIMEEDGSLAKRVINEYHGLNLSRPPRITSVSSVEQALGLLRSRTFDLVLAMPRLGGMDCGTFAARVKELHEDLPVIMLAHSLLDVVQGQGGADPACVDNTYVWCCDASLLLAIVKSVEDRMNADFDTAKAMVRVILYVEDSPVHRSRILPILYNEIVRQTQAVLDEGLNDHHRLLKMRARPKILTAATYEEAVEIVTRYRNNIYALLTDIRFRKGGSMDPGAGLLLIEEVRRELRDVPVLVLSTDPVNGRTAAARNVTFAIKDGETIRESIRDFFSNYLGFGDFVFKMPDGREVGRASSLFEFERMLRIVPGASLLYHARRNHFSHWVMARAEIALASRLSGHHFAGVEQAEHLREDIIFKVHALRRLRQKGVVSQFSRDGFDPAVTDFVSIGGGSLGGKARGMAFVSSQLRSVSYPESLLGEYMVRVPRTCVITTQGFDEFIERNRLSPDDDLSNGEIMRRFEKGEMPGWLLDDLRAYLERVDYPLSVRSSSMLEDAHFRPYAGLYSTYMLTNSDPDFGVRLAQLIRAVKLVYASTWFEGPRSFSRAIGQHERDSMAVVIQRLVGRMYGNHFYPPVSGTIQSFNYYPVPPMRPEDGIAHIALGFGKTVVEGERSLRFCPRYPENLPQLATAEEMLKNTQRWFYSLDCSNPSAFTGKNSNLVRREIDAAAAEYPVRLLSSTYFPEEQRVRDADLRGPKVLTFASLLKYGHFPMAKIMEELISLGREGMGCEMEMEFALELDKDPRKSVFHILQIRPMVTAGERMEVEITARDRGSAVIFSDQSLGHGLIRSIQDIVYVKPECFDASRTRDMAAEIGKMGRTLCREGRRFLLIGFGRWGTADPWLGIPVKWHDISCAGAIVEIQGHGVTAEPSQGAHFFHNLTSLGIPYLLVREAAGKAPAVKGMDWNWIEGLEAVQETEYIRHVRPASPLYIKVNGRDSEAVVLPSP